MPSWKKKHAAWVKANVKPKGPTDCASPALACQGRATRGCGLCGKCCASKHFYASIPACREPGPGVVWEPCDGCNGFGSFTGGASCQRCGGKGQVAR